MRGTPVRGVFLVVFSLAVATCGGGTGGGGGSPQTSVNLRTGFSNARGPNDQVFSVAVAKDGSGDVYVGGSFIAYNSSGVNRIVRLNADGTVDAGFAIGTGFDGTVRTIAPANDGSGDVYVGGLFLTYNGTGANRIARLNANGTRDTGFATGTGFDFNVFTIAPANDSSGDVYVGGAFGAYNGAGASRIVRLNADGTADTGFAIGTGFNDTVNAIAPAGDGGGDVYVGGNFTTYNGAPINRIVRLNANGTVDAGFAIGTGFNGTVFTVAPTGDGSGDVYVGGDFTTYNGAAANRIVRLKADGTLDAGFVIDAGFFGTVRTIALAGDGSVYIGGDFSSINLFGAGYVTRLSADGTVRADLGPNNAVSTVAPAGDGSGDVYIGGNFTICGSAGTNRVVRLNADDTVDTAFTIGTGFNDTVNTIAPATDGSGDIYVGGFFTAYDGTPANFILRLNADGTVDTGFTVDTNTVVNTIATAVDGSGDVFVGRGTSDTCALASCIVRLHANGTVDANFAIGTGFNGTVFTIVPANDGSGDVYVGGEFTTYNGAAANRIARLNANGTLAAGFAVGTGFNGTVRAMALANDGSGDVYAGGLFTTYNGTGANRVVRLNADGTRDAGFATGAFDGDVYAIAPAVDGSGDLYVGGLFTTYNGGNASAIVRLHANGGNAGAISFGFNGNVLAIAPAGDGSGDVYFGGFFTTYNLAPTNRIVRLNANGTVDAGFATGTAFTGIFPTGVVAIALANDGSGDVFAGGFFSVYKTTTADRLVRLDSGGTLR